MTPDLSSTQPLQINYLAVIRFGITLALYGSGE